MLHKEAVTKIGIRFDDITPTMNWKKFYRIQKVLDELGIKPLLGVVPDNKDENLKVNTENTDFWNWVRDCQANGYSIAMHGYQHLYKTKKAGIFPLNGFSEFAGEDVGIQNEKIVAGKKIFDKHGVSTNVFMAPGHSFDKVTIKLLSQHGFQYVSDGYGRHVYCRRNSAIKFIPIMSKDEYMRGDYELTTVVYHLNTCDRNMIRNCETFLRKNQKRIVPYSDFFNFESSVQTTGERMAELALATRTRIITQRRRIVRRLSRN